MPIYNLLEYSDNYNCSMTSESLQRHEEKVYRDEINCNANENNIVRNEIIKIKQ